MNPRKEPTSGTSVAEPSWRASGSLSLRRPSIKSIRAKPSDIPANYRVVGGRRCGTRRLLHPDRAPLGRNRSSSSAIHRLPSKLAGKTLVQFSDIHIGYVNLGYVLDAFARLAELNADIVVITGDLIGLTGGVFDMLPRVYAQLPKGRYATVATLGNHDYGTRWREEAVAERVIEHVTPAGITVLRNEVYDCEGLQIVGMDDWWARKFRPAQAFAAMDHRRAAIVLSHNPDTVDLSGWDDYEGWILAGHTHGGQCRPPFLPPPVLPVRNRRYTAGEFALDGNRRLYISRGLGHRLPIRFNVRPEVTVFELRAV